jgi:hypothetical protein
LEWDAIKQMLAYRGRVSVFFFARSEHDIGPFLAVVPPDGEMDTELFVELLDETIENGDEAPIFVEVAGRELTLLREGPDEPLSTLVRTEDGALLLIGVDPQLGPVEEQLARVLNLFDGLDDEKSSATGTSTSTSDDSSAAIVFRVLPGIGGLFLEGMRSGQQDPSEMETALEALRALGADRLRGYDVMVRAEGSRIRIDSALRTSIRAQPAKPTCSSVSIRSMRAASPSSNSRRATASAGRRSASISSGPCWACCQPSRGSIPAVSTPKRTSEP